MVEAKALNWSDYQKNNLRFVWMQSCNVIVTHMLYFVIKCVDKFYVFYWNMQIPFPSLILWI